MNRPVVLLESPYANNPDAPRYLACAILDSVLRGESPIASHPISPLALPEYAEAYGGRTGREIGLECRDAIAQLMQPVLRSIMPIRVVRYVDLGISEGMKRSQECDDRYLEGEARRIWNAGEWPTKARLTLNH